MEKNPAAVALGKLRAQTFTPEEIAAFQRTGTEASRQAWQQRTWDEKREIARKRRIARRVNPPKWMQRAQERIARDAATPATVAEPSAASVDPAEVAALQEALAGLTDEEIARLAEALTKT
jgi:hypothetical protein